MDKTLLVKLKENNQQAINETYIRNKEPCTKYVKGNSGSEQHAEDNYQDTWIVFLNRLNKEVKLKDENLTGVDAYLKGINRNLWLKYLKNRKKVDFE